ncbi:MAG: hypothetical protein H8D46_04415, partial [FCB group bacterium]|nr:hypothetical protein [FCB group bacterium]
GCNSEFLPVDKSVENHYDLPLIVGITDSLTTDSLHSDGEAILQEVLELTQLMRSDYQSLYTWTASIEIEKSEVTFKNHNKRSTKVLCSRESIQNQLEVLKAFEETVADSRKLDDYYYINLTLPNYVIVKEKNI